MTDADIDKIEELQPALDNLSTCQRQLDMDGCEVGVSRQALDEVLNAFAVLIARLEAAEAGVIADKKAMKTAIRNRPRIGKTTPM